MKMESDFISVCVCVYIYIYMFVCVCIYIYTHILTNSKTHGERNIASNIKKKVKKRRRIRFSRH